MSPQPDTCKPLSACVCVCVCVTPQHLSYWIQTRCWDDNLIPSCSGWAEWVESGLQLTVQCPAKNLQAFLWHNRTPWKFGKCCCINVQLEKPKPLKQSRRAQDWPSWSMVCKPLFPGLTTRWRCPSQSCEKCRYSWKYISHWFLKDLPVKVQTFFPVVSQRVRSGQWYGKGILGLVTGYKEQLLENSSFWTVSVCQVPPLPRVTVQGKYSWLRDPKNLTFYYLRMLCMSQVAQRWPHLQQHLRSSDRVHTLCGTGLMTSLRPGAAHFQPAPPCSLLHSASESRIRNMDLSLP